MKIHAEISVTTDTADEGWAVTWNSETNTPLFMESQVAFEAKRAAERAING